MGHQAVGGARPSAASPTSGVRARGARPISLADHDTIVTMTREYTCDGGHPNGTACRGAAGHLLALLNHMAARPIPEDSNAR